MPTGQGDGGYRLLARYREAAVRAEIMRLTGARLLADADAESPLAPAAAPNDPVALRGLPAVGGRGSVGGAILGTRPDHAIMHMRDRPR